MAALATLEDVETLTGSPLGCTAAQAAFLLDVVSSEVRAAAASPVSEQEDTITVNGNGRRRLFLPGLPVTEVTDVEVDGVAVTDWTLDPGGVLRRTTGGVWPYGYDEANIEVTYTHGEDPVPDWVIGLVVWAVRRAADAGVVPAVGVKRERLDGHEVEYFEGGGAVGVSLGDLLTDDERALVEQRYRPLVVA